MSAVSAFQGATVAVAYAIEAAAVLIVALAACEAIVRALLAQLRDLTSSTDETGGVAPEAARLRLGRWLSLGLKLTLGADILRTAVAPTWEEIGRLAAIVVLRTTLNYFLRQEIEHAARRQSVQSSCP